MFTSKKLKLEFFLNFFIMKKIVSLFYGLVCYLAFFGTILYAIGFVGNLVVPKTIDSDPQISLSDAILVNASLLLLFALQHSIMARASFKRWWTKIIPGHLERSTYVLLASLCLMLMMWQWQPIGGTVWSIENEKVKAFLLFTYLFGWVIVFVSTFLINHFDLFGLRQTWLYFRGKNLCAIAIPCSIILQVCASSFIPGIFDRLLVHPRL
jgi:protein-S-isoprenylcysteine O-methyltransferase Ste14